MKLAYLIHEFPKPSETFVSREVSTLQDLGLLVVPFAFSGPDAEALAKLDGATQKVAARTHYLSALAGISALPCHCGGLGRLRAKNARLQQEATLPTSKAGRLLRAAALARRLERDKVTHLHAHWPYATQIAYLVHQLSGLPFSVSIHAHEVAHDYGHFPAVFESLSFATFCNGAAMERLLGTLPPAARSKSHLVYHGVDLSRFAALPFPEVTSPLRVVSAGRLTRTKGFDRLVQACARFHAEGGAVELTILGEGSMKEELLRLAESAGFAAHLHLPGWLPHDQIAEQLRAAHVFALMADTEFHDGLPNVVIEAMASARPIILSPLPAAHEAVTDGVEGFVLSAANDIDGMVEALRLCAASPGNLSTMGLAARERAARLFDQNLHGRHLQTLFLETAARQSTRNEAPRPSFK